MPYVIRVERLSSLFAQIGRQVRLPSLWRRPGTSYRLYGRSALFVSIDRRSGDNACK